MKTWIGAAVALSAWAAASSAYAAAILPGQTLAGISVPGTSSVYEVFGHAGNPGGDYGPDTAAILITFGAGAGNKFTFSVTGLVSCCSDPANIPPDGSGGGMNVGGANGLSSLSGNQHIPFVAVFTTDVDPFGGAAPSALAFDVNNPASLSPDLNQVFYVGDGKSGYLDAGGTTLVFTAPATATRLYIGVIDAFGFGNQTGYYNDNRGEFSADVHLERAVGGVPEPATLALFGAGLAGLGALRRRKSKA